MTDMDQKLTEAVETIIKLKVAEALEGKETLIESMVLKILEDKTLSDDGKKSYVQDWIEARIENIVRRELQEFMTENAEAIKATIHSKAKPIMDKLADQIIDGLKTDDWRVKFHLTFGE